MEHLRRDVNSTIRDNFISCHKVHILLLLGHGMHLNKLINNEELLACALSLVTNKNVYPPKRVNLKYLEQFTNWLHNKIKLSNELCNHSYSTSIDELLKKRIGEKKVYKKRELVLLFVIIARALGMTTRLVASFRPLDWRPKTKELFTVANIKKDDSDEQNDIKIKSKNKKVLSSSSEEGMKKEIKTILKSVRKKRSKSDESESDCDDIPIKKRNKLSVSRKETKTKGTSPNANAGTSGSKKRDPDVTLWAEVYSEEEEQWICIDVVNNRVHCIDKLAVSFFYSFKKFDKV